MYDGCCAFCRICDACSLKRYWSGSIFVLACRCCVFTPYVAVVNAAFCLVLSCGGC